MGAPLVTEAPRPGQVPVRRQPLVPSGVLGMVLFILSEIMLFAGLISAFIIVKASAPGGRWPPAGQPRLPADETLVNTIFLVLSGVLAWGAFKVLTRSSKQAKILLGASIALGALFVALQGREWVAMLNVGLTMTSSTHGSFFYLVVGLHGLHAVIALVALGWSFNQLRKDALTRVDLATVLAFWTFVVLVWPVLYVQVYL